MQSLTEPNPANTGDDPHIESPVSQFLAEYDLLYDLEHCLGAALHSLSYQPCQDTSFEVISPNPSVSPAIHQEPLKNQTRYLY